MSFQQKPNSGALFKNDRKESESHPDYKGDINIEGRNYWISAWLKEGKKGKFLSLSLSEKKAPDVNAMADKREAQDRRQRPNPSQRRVESPQNSFDDDIPF